MLGLMLRASSIEHKISKCWNPKSNKLGAVLGHRVKSNRTKKESWQEINKVGSKLYGVRIGKDFNCGLRVFHRSAILPWIRILPNGFSASLTSTLLVIERQIPHRFFDNMVTRGGNIK